MYAANWFQDRLDEEFGGRLRIRWSKQQGAWVIEQKVRPARGRVGWEEIRDSVIRAKEGYWHVMTVQPGNRVGCPGCGMEILIPTGAYREVVCGHCQWRQKDGRWMAGYWPLGESLIEYLKRIDPLRDGHRTEIAAADAHNAALEAEQERINQDKRHGVLWEAGERQIPKVGWTRSLECQ